MMLPRSAIDTTIAEYILHMLGSAYAGTSISVDNLPDRNVKRLLMDLNVTVCAEINRTELDFAMQGGREQVKMVTDLIGDALIKSFQAMPLFNEATSQLATRFETAERTILALQEANADLQKYKTHFSLECDLRRAGK